MYFVDYQRKEEGNTLSDVGKHGWNVTTATNKWPDS